jgi:tetratricopeptide (TPR) repeat protein
MPPAARMNCAIRIVVSAALTLWNVQAANRNDAPAPEQPVAIVVAAASDATIRREGFEFPLPANPGDLLFQNDTLAAAFAQVATDCRTDHPHVCGIPKEGYTAGKNDTALACDSKPLVCRLPAVPRQVSSESEHIQAIRQQIAELPTGARKEDDDAETIRRVSDRLGPDDGTPLYKISLATELEIEKQLAASQRNLGDASERWPVSWLPYHRADVLDRLYDKLEKGAAGDSKNQVAALVIGVSQYDKPDTKFGNLKYAHSDAQSFANYLNHPDLGIKATVLVNGEATRQRIDQELGILRDKLATGGTGVVFISSHGFEQNGHAYIAPSNAFRTGEQPTAIGVDRILDSLRSVSRAYVFIDACRNNWSDPRGVLQQTVDKDPFLAPSSELLALYGAQPGEFSREGHMFCAGNGPLACPPDGGHGAFSFYLLSALYGNQRQAITGEQLRVKVAKEMDRLPFQQRLRPGGNFQMDRSLTPLLQVPPRQIANATPRRPYGFTAPIRPAFYRPFQIPQPPPAATRRSDWRQRLAPDRIDEQTARDVVAECCSGSASTLEDKSAVRIALEEAGQSILLRYLDGEENPPKPEQFRAANTYYSLAQSLLPDSQLLGARVNFTAGRARLFDLITAAPDQREVVFRSAADLLVKAQTADPGSAYILNALGIGYLELAQPETARAALRDAIKEAPKWAYPRHNLALAMMRMGTPRDAIAQYQEAIAGTDDRGYLHFNLGLLYQQTNNLKKASAEYDKVEKILDARNETSGQNRAMLYNVRGTLAAQLGKTDEAESKYRLADQALPGMKEAKHNLALLKSGQEREDLLRDNVSLNGYFESRVELAATLKQAGKFDQAIQEYLQILKLNPDFAAARVELARTYIQKGNVDPNLLQTANAELQRIPAADRNHWRVWLAAAEAASVRGNPQEAGKDYAAARKTAVTPEDRKAIRESEKRERHR